MSKSIFRILTTSNQVAPYVESVIDLADANKGALGFLPKTAFREQANKGRLWIAVSSDTNNCIGYLLFGGKYPALRIFQLYVQKQHRKSGVGKELLTTLVNWGEKCNYLNISARVAADLSSNRFWERVDFAFVRQVPGGTSTDRMINIRVRGLNTPSLLDMMSYKASGPKVGIQHIRIEQGPIVGIQKYVLDLNIFFDIIKKRIHRAEAARLINAGLDQQVRLIVTPEFTRELKRNSPQDRQDPVLEFAMELPVLPEISISEINGLMSELKPLIFPAGISSDQHHAQSVSDLTHLAYCIHHGVTGFITREKAILSASEQLLEIYFLEVLSPSDLMQPAVHNNRTRASVHANIGRESVSVGPATEAQRSNVEKFLITHGVVQRDLGNVWHPGTVSSPRRRMIARIGTDLRAVASWDDPSNFSNSNVLYLYVDETSSGAEIIIDHILEAVTRDVQPLKVRMIILDTPIDQAKTRITAEKRGFLKSFQGGFQSAVGQLSKLTFSGLISSKNWSVFRSEVEKVARLRLPIRIPTFEEFTNTGIVVKNLSDKLICKLNLFDFETLVSPGIVLCPGRTAMVVPIKMRFAQDLFMYVQPQGKLFPSPEALLRVEKAYFRSTKKASQFSRGMLVLFYLSGSGKGTKEIIGCARVTFSSILSIDKIELNLGRQGVLSKSELQNIANSKGKIHVFTFDNYNAFPSRIPFSLLKNRAMISGTNLITAEPLSSKHCVQVCEFGFGLRSKNDA